MGAEWIFSKGPIIEFFQGVAKKVFVGKQVVRFHFTNSEIKKKTFFY